jgi:hypothetical protein
MAKLGVRILAVVSAGVHMNDCGVEPADFGPRDCMDKGPFGTPLDIEVDFNL